MICANKIIKKLYGFSKNTKHIAEWCGLLNVPYNIERRGAKTFVYIDEFDSVILADFILLPKQQKYEYTCGLKYGVNNVSCLETVKLKKEKTTFKHYGVLNPFQSNEIKEKLRETNRQKYGYKSAMQNPDIKQKVRDFYLKNFGVINNSCLPEEKEQRRKGMIRLNLSGGMLSKKYIYDGVSFDSAAEVYYYIYNKKILHNDIQRGKNFEYFVNGIRHIYECDFLVNGENIEIKGEHLINEGGELVDFYGGKEVLKEKTQCLRNNNVKIILDKDLKEVTAEVDEMFPGVVKSSRRGK